MKRPNVILIVIDALRARNLGCYGMPGNPSPHLDALAKEGILFEQAYSCWNTTDPSLTAIMTGKYPRSHGIMNHGDKATQEVRNVFSRTGTRLLAERLQEVGYTTSAVDWMGRWFKRGFDQYGYKMRRTALKQLGHWLKLPVVYGRYAFDHLPILRCYKPVRKPSWKDRLEGLKGVFSTFAFTYHLAEIQDAASVTSLANEFLQQPLSKPFFLFLHYWDTHTPYHCPRRHIARGTNFSDPKSLLTARYEGAVNYVDLQLNRLFDELKRQKLWEHTLLVITSDHGDSLTEHEIYFDHHGLYEESIHVPLILHYPAELEGGRRLAGFVQHVDLVPTICELAGANGDADGDGLSLQPLITGKMAKLRDWVFMEESYVQRKAALRNDRYKYIKAVGGNGWCRYCEKVHVGQEELYDLQKDPRELTDLTQKCKTVAEEMKGELNRVIEKLDQKRECSRNVDRRPRKTSDDHLDPEEERLIRKRLQDLGYLAE